MDILNEMINVLRIAIIPIGVTGRVIFCLIKMIYDEEAQGSYKKKISNTIIRINICYKRFDYKLLLVIIVISRLSIRFPN